MKLIGESIKENNQSKEFRGFFIWLIIDNFKNMLTSNFSSPNLGLSEISAIILGISTKKSLRI